MDFRLDFVILLEFFVRTFCVLHVQGIIARSREIRLSEFAFIQLKSDEKGKNKIIHSPIYASSE